MMRACLFNLSMFACCYTQSAAPREDEIVSPVVEEQPNVAPLEGYPGDSVDNIRAQQELLSSDRQPSAGIADASEGAQLQEEGTAPTDQESAVPPSGGALSPSPPPRRKTLLDSPYCTDGAYAVYTEENGGSLFTVWRDKRPENAVAYAKPNSTVKVPAYKYKGRTEICRNLHNSNIAVASGVLQFYRSMKQYQCRCALLDLYHEAFSKLSQFVVFSHNVDGRITVVHENSPMFNLSHVDCMAAVLINTAAEPALLKFVDKPSVSQDELSMRVKTWARQADFISFNRDV